MVEKMSDNGGHGEVSVGVAIIEIVILDVAVRAVSLMTLVQFRYG